MGMKIAILDVDEAARALTQKILSNEGFECSAFSGGRALVRALHQESFDFFVIDWDSPDLAVLNVVEWIRNHIGAQPPVLLLTKNGNDEDLVAGLKAGADDFLAKPLQPQVLLARVHALARRAAILVTRTAEIFGPFEFELASRTVRRGGAAVHVTPKEFSLALLLFRNLNQAISRAYIFETIWGMNAGLSTRTLDIHVSKIRSKLELKPPAEYCLSPVYGYGYRLEEHR